MTVRRSFLLLSENGKTLSRTYEIVGGNETLSELLFKEENKVDHFMEYLFGTDSDKISKFSTGTLTLNESSEIIRIVTLMRILQKTVSGDL